MKFFEGKLFHEDCAYLSRQLLPSLEFKLSLNLNKPV